MNDKCIYKTDNIIKLSTNIDDMSAEEIAFAMDIMLRNEALDVYCNSIYMKKNRIGTEFVVLTDESKKEKIVELIFKHTTILGIREEKITRYILDRKVESIDTDFGKVNIKKSFGYNTYNEKIEFEDLKKIAMENNLSIKDIKKIISSSINKV